MRLNSLSKHFLVTPSARAASVFVAAAFSLGSHSYGAALANAPVATQDARAGAPDDASDTLRIYYVGYAVGYERWTLENATDGVHRLTSELDYVDRGRRTRLRMEGSCAPDWSAKQLETVRLTDTSRVTDSRIVVTHNSASVEYRTKKGTVAVPSGVFAITGTSPVAQHLALVRYWLARGKPATIHVIPGGPTNVVRVTWKGRDTLRRSGGTTVLDRYAVDGVVWGTETVWTDESGRLAAFSTAGGGGLTFEGVRLPLEPFLARLRSSATSDRLSELAALSRALPRVASGTVALVGATLIDGTGRAPISDAVVVVSDGMIRSAGARTTVSIPPGAKRVDVAGRTIIPGLWDMHTHLMQTEWAPVYLAAGVTTTRDMGNLIDFIVPFRAAVDSGRVVGPRMLLAGLVDGGGPNAFGAENATTPEEGRAVVRRYHDLGFEQMKLYSLLTPAVVGAIAREAHRLGMTVTGHVPNALTLSAAVDSGMDQVAHLPIRGDAASDSVQRQIAHLKARGTVVDPTASWGEILSHSTAEPIENFQPGINRLPPVLAQRIGAMGIATVDSATAHARLARTLAIIGALHKAGVPVVAGTDEGVPGFSVYREIELYVAAGLSPIDAIRAASAVGAKAMGIDGRVGTIEPGKFADLVVLDGDPIARISDVRRVELVMKGGELFRSADIWKAAGFR